MEHEGRSKTTAIAEYFSENGQCNYIKAGEFHRGMTLLHELIFHLTGETIEEFTSARAMVNHVASLLTFQRGEKKLIVIDDADKLSPNVLELFSELRDATIDCASIVFVGRPDFVENLKHWKEEKKGVREFYKKVGRWFHQAPELRDCEKLAYSRLLGINPDEELSGILSCNSMSEVEHFVNTRLRHKARPLFGL